MPEWPCAPRPAGCTLGKLGMIALKRHGPINQFAFFFFRGLFLQDNGRQSWTRDQSRRGTMTMARDLKRFDAGEKAARTRKRKAAGVKSAKTKVRRLVAHRAAQTRRRRSLPQRFDDVEFEFLSMDEALAATGTVAIRPDVMIIDIPGQDTTHACLVEGHLTGHVYIGSNTLRQEEPLRIHARWADLGNCFAGIWIEEGIDYFSRFQLPRRS